ncbi:MAG: hypothetical protein BAA01_10695 [Bacillus thermozeamaize]|uniref:Tripartite ATP-independent periplasmic transporters DctQ component domain-containing protein n=1 Tax=Bacillus thermozeamaize TaxID=230954 RepID=A0A1Y3PKP1_9BACI|nr:MAG: hypothetical protein BAA01_10695 [Bacillus thermozeamaize]
MIPVTGITSAKNPFFRVIKMKLILRYFDRLERAMFLVSQIAVFLMMILTTADAVCRYVLRQPIVGVFEFTTNYLMVITVFLSMSYVMRIKGHITIDLITERLPAKWVGYFRMVFLFLGAVMMFILGYQGVGLTIEAWEKGYTTMGLIPWPMWISYVCIPIGMFLFCIRLLFEIVHTFKGTDDSDVSRPLID